MQGRFYDAVLALPERAGLARLRAELVAGLRGRVLEVGVGTGLNLSFYPPEVREVVGLDPDEGMLRQAEDRVRRSGADDASRGSCVSLVAGSAEELPFATGSFDAAVATLAFCTIPEPDLALRELRRTLRPGGEVRLMEHVRVESIGRLQELATPVWKRVAGGCHLDRETEERVRAAGFEVRGVERRLGGALICIFARSPG